MIGGKLWSHQLVLFSEPPPEGTILAPMVEVTPVTLYVPSLTLQPYTITAPLDTEVQSFFGPVLYRSILSLTAPEVMNTPTIYAFAFIWDMFFYPPFLTNSVALSSPGFAYTQEMGMPVLHSTTVIYNAGFETVWDYIDTPGASTWIDVDIPV